MGADKNILNSIIIIIFLMSGICYSQNLYLKYNELNDIATFATYKGRFIRVDNDLIRYRIYGRKYIQVTYIKKYKRTELRLYAYFNLFNGNITPALSIRYRL